MPVVSPSASPASLVPWLLLRTCGWRAGAPLAASSLLPVLLLPAKVAPLTADTSCKSEAFRSGTAAAMSSPDVTTVFTICPCSVVDVGERAWVWVRVRVSARDVVKRDQRDIDEDFAQSLSQPPNPSHPPTRGGVVNGPNGVDVGVAGLERNDNGADLAEHRVGA